MDPEIAAGLWIVLVSVYLIRFLRIYRQVRTKRRNLEIVSKHERSELLNTSILLIVFLLVGLITLAIWLVSYYL